MKPQNRLSIRWLLAAGLLWIALGTGVPVIADRRAAPQFQGATVVPTAVPTPAYVPGPIAETVRVESQTRPSVPVPGEPATVEFSLTGRAGRDCSGIPRRPVDLAMVFDISTSAGDGSPGSNWERTVALTQALMDYLTRPIYRDSGSAAEVSRVALVTSRTGTKGPEPLLLQPVTDDYALLRAQINTLTPSGDTDIAAGVRLAVEELKKTPRDRASAIVLMLHDNTDVENAKNAINAAQAQNIPVYLVINSLNITEKQLKPTMMAPVVQADRIYLDPKAEALRTLFLGVTEAVTGPAAMDLRVVEEIGPLDQVKVLDATGPEAKKENNRVTWRLPALKSGETTNLSYRFSFVAGLALSRHITVLWLDCNGYPQSASDNKTVSIREAGATPTRLPEPTPTRAVIITEEATPVSVVPGVPTAPALPGEVPIPPDTSIAFQWWWLILLLLLLLLLLLAFLWRRRTRRSSGTPPGVKPGPRDGEPGPGDAGTAKTRRKPGMDVTHGWRVEQKITSTSRKLTIRTRSDPATGQDAGIRLRVDDDSARELVHVDMTLKVEQQADPVTGIESILRCVRVDLLTAIPNQWKEVGPYALERIETYARERGAREVLLTEASKDYWPLFRDQGYQIRAGGTELIKAIAPVMPTSP